MAAAWLLNLPQEAPGFVPVVGVPLHLTVGEGSTSNGKLPEAVRVALQGGEYDAGALRLSVKVIRPDGTEAAELPELIVDDLPETALPLFGHHPSVPGELTNPAFEVTVANLVRQFTPGDSTGLWPDGDYSGWGLDLVVQEFITDPAGGDEIFRQRMALAEVTDSNAGPSPVATLVAVHPAGGWLSKRWSRDDSTLLDWNGAAHQ